MAKPRDDGKTYYEVPKTTKPNNTGVLPKAESRGESSRMAAPSTKPKKKVRSWKAWAIISESGYLRVKLDGACGWDKKSDAQRNVLHNDDVVSVTITENRPSGRRKGR